MGTEARFVGSIPAVYEEHMGPMLFEPYAKELAQRLPPSALRIIEIAAGTGRLTRHLMRAMPANGELVVTDLNEPMITEAKKHLGSDPRLSFRVADMQALPFPDASANAVLCQFGLMFAPDKPLAMREMKRVLAPGGILLLAVWDDLAQNPASEILHEQAFETMPNDPPMFMRLPFSMGDAHELERLATEAGFHGVRVDTVTKPGVAESAAHIAKGFVRGNPLWLQLTERGIDVDAFERTLAAKLANRYGDRPCESPMSAHVLTAFA